MPCLMMLVGPILAAALLPMAPSPPLPPPSPAREATDTSPSQPASTPAPPGQDIAAFQARLAAVDAKMAAVVDLRAEYEQHKRTAMLKKPLVSRGSLVCKGETVLWRTVTPRACDMLVADGKVTIHYPDDAMAEIYSIGSRFRDAAGGPLPRLAKLKANFEITELAPQDVAPAAEAQDLTGRLAMKLTPTSDELKEHVAMIRVLIDESIPCADRIVIVDPDGDETEMRFTAVKINTAMQDSELQLILPKGTKVSAPAGAGK